jgi:hypothetical protein
MNAISALGRYCHPGVSVDAQRICSIFGNLASHWIGSATGQARVAEPMAALFQLYQRCHVEDWNGEDADAISFEALEEASKLLGLLPSSIPTPEFLPEPTGAIAFEWYQGRNRVYLLSISGKKTIEFARLLGYGNEIHGKTNFEDSLPQVIQDQLREFFRQ